MDREGPLSRFPDDEPQARPAERLAGDAPAPVPGDSPRAPRGRRPSPRRRASSGPGPLASLARLAERWRAHPAGTPSMTAVAVALMGVSLALAGVAARQAPAHPVLQPARKAPEKPPVFRPRTDVIVRPAASPTPVLATLGGLEVRLPVPPRTVTLIAFHQAGGGRGSRHMRPAVPLSRLSEVASAAVAASASVTATGPDESAEVASAEATTAPPSLDGKVIRLYRTGRTGSADTAVDVGARGGSTVLAPVSGTVVAVHRYLLYGQYQDYEVHIIPDGFERVDVTMLHLSDPAVKPGQRVEAGITAIARVRWLSKLFDSQLDEYTHDGGNHVHIQLDTAPRPGVVKLLGTQSLEGLPGSGLSPKSGAATATGGVTPAEDTPPRD